MRSAVIVYENLPERIQYDLGPFDSAWVPGRLVLRKRSLDAELIIETIQEKALHLKAVRTLEVEEREPKVALLQPDNTERLNNSLNNSVESLSLSRGSRSDNRCSFRGKKILEGVAQETIIKAENSKIRAEEIEGVLVTREEDTEPHFPVNPREGANGHNLERSLPKLIEKLDFKVQRLPEMQST